MVHTANQIASGNQWIKILSFLHKAWWYCDFPSLMLTNSHCQQLTTSGSIWGENKKVENTGCQIQQWSMLLLIRVPLQYKCRIINHLSLTVCIVKNEYFLTRIFRVLKDFFFHDTFPFYWHFWYAFHYEILTVEIDERVPTQLICFYINMWNKSSSQITLLTMYRSIYIHPSSFVRSCNDFMWNVHWIAKKG